MPEELPFYAEEEDVVSLVEKLGIPADTDAAKWIRQQEEAGVLAIDILATLATAGKVTPAKFKRVPIDGLG